MNTMREAFIRINVCYLFFILILTLYHFAQAEGNHKLNSPLSNLPAFPGAEGFGSNTVGGRGGRVIKVTNLNSEGPGSLADACAQEGPRIVVFDVSGVIKANEEGIIKIKYPYITIAGQTALGAGITIDGMLMADFLGYKPKPSIVHDVVIRFLRIRPTNSEKREANGDALQFGNVHNLVLDHISCSWSCDETVDLCSADNVTVQWCTIEESSIVGHPEGAHNLGMIASYGSHSISVHHTLFTHHIYRNPVILSTGPLDIRNTVVYNHGVGSSVGTYKSASNVTGNVVSNYYKTGPNSHVWGGELRPEFPYALKFVGGDYYVKDNCVDDPDLGGPYIFDDPVKAMQTHPHIAHSSALPETLLNEAVGVPPVTTHSVLEAYDFVLNKAGCFPRDVVTKRIVQEVREGTGSWGKNIPNDLMEGLTPTAPPQDTDNDGMPDEWEDEHGFNKNDSSDNNQILASGYTAIEEYINELANSLIDKGLTITTSSLPDGTVETAYSQQLQVIGGVSPYTWNIVTGSLPSGLSLSGDGTISGIPQQEEIKTFTVRVVDNEGKEATKELSIFVVTSSCSIEEPDFSAPTKFSLQQNYPNPFNPGTTIKYRLRDQGCVSLIVYDLLGQKVKTLVNDNLPPGNYHVHWTGEDEAGHAAAAGIYFCQFKTKGFVCIKKMVRLN